MRRIFALIALVLALLATSGHSTEAREYPWCAYHDWSTYNCGFVSFQQCLATISGIGGWCARNPWTYYAPQDKAPYRKRPRG
ncbi:MAG: DUF3551 domain-containing protein [Rhizobiales bacterium]|nr:DUF3551 domain-containing protein [Hyphomicrobiales bacterium]